MAKIILKKHAVMKKEEEVINPLVFNPEQEPIEIIQAAYAKIGEKYYNHSFSSIVTITSINTNDKRNIYDWDVVCSAESLIDCDISFTTKIRGTTPLVPYKEKYTLGGVIEMATVKKAIAGKSAKQVAAGKKLGARAKEGIDPTIGAKKGTDAWSIGKIMLGIPAGPEHRKKSMVKIVAFLLDTGRFDEAKAKTLGASWYSTLVNRKADIYGKFKVTKDVAVKKNVAKETKTKKVVIKKKK